ncbi:MAG: hypothetical protein A2868_03725 [Candidatus Levybacteria bacterium RIFCSPHIGHO2_01_FULL_40_15b]|nr:MAG: hypothetical protein A2868_03725 [Candidatus Levybacteria bacterium RIFCSPHIGHO2_01_FULL_40_15b]
MWRLSSNAAAVLPNPEILISTIEKILRVFENVIQMDLMKVRWEEIKNKKVSKYIATPTFQALMEGHKVLKLTTQLENRNSNITTQLSSIIKAFEDFRLVAQIKEGIERVSYGFRY